MKSIWMKSLGLFVGIGLVAWIGGRFLPGDQAFASGGEKIGSAPPSLEDSLRDLRRRMDGWRNSQGWGLPDDDFFRSPFEQEFKSMLEQFRLDPLVGSGRSGASTGALRTDIIERDGKLIVTIDLPGQTRESIDLRVKDNALVLISERKQQNQVSNDQQKVYRSEISYGTMRRVIQLPRKVLENQVSARYENGSLIVTAPLDTATPAPDAEGRKITIE